MSWFSGSSGGPGYVSATGGQEFSSALYQILMADDIVPGADPSYELCKLIYLYHPLGKKMADAPVEMATAKRRVISVPTGPADVVAREFERVHRLLNVDDYLRALHASARVYGISTLGCGQRGMDPGEPLDLTKFKTNPPFFSVFDPLNTAGSIATNQDPNAPDFLKSAHVSVAGKTWHPSRCCVVFNERPVYIAWSSSGFGFVGRSVFQRPLFPLKSFIRTMLADEQLATKVGVIVAKLQSPGSIVTQTMQAMFAQRRQQIKQSQTGNVMSIGVGEDISSFNLQNADGSLSVARNNILLNIATATPMPAKILNQETFAQGFGEGTEDAEQVIRYLEEVRLWMGTGYDFTDRIVQAMAWTPEFFETVQRQYREIAKEDYTTAFYSWSNSFEAVWPPLREEPESERVKVDEAKLAAVLQVVQLLLPLCRGESLAMLLIWMASVLNENKNIFTTPLDLDWESIAVAATEQREMALEAQAGSHPDDEKK